MTGSSTTKRAPPCGTLSAQMRPSCSRTMPSEIESPRPVPEPVGLVVKKGLKIRSIRFAGIPPPVSSISMRMVSPLRRVRTVRRWWWPSRCSIACSALVMRLRNTCWSWCASAIVSGNDSSYSRRTSMPRTRSS